MLTNRAAVDRNLQAVRKNAQKFFIPLGGYDKTTRAKAEISNLTGTLYNHLPPVRAIVDSVKSLPFYVGYDGRAVDDRAGTYSRNLVLLHEAADESTLSFIQAYAHELIHLDQDCRALLREDVVSLPPSEQLSDYLAHNLMLEAAPYATEAVSLYYLSNHSALRDADDDVEDYFDDYVSELAGRELLPSVIGDALEGRDVQEFQDMKPAWQAVFQSFFDPDSLHVGHYLKYFTERYLCSLDRPARAGRAKPQQPLSWGGLEELRQITTIPGMGEMFSADALPVLRRAVFAAILQDRHIRMIDVARDMADRKTDRYVGKVMDLMRHLTP